MIAATATQQPQYKSQRAARDMRMPPSLSGCRLCMLLMLSTPVRGALPGATALCSWDPEAFDAVHAFGAGQGLELRAGSHALAEICGRDAGSMQPVAVQARLEQQWQ